MKPTQQLAEELASNAAELAYAHKQATFEDFQEAIKQEIPLLELLEVARAARIQEDTYFNDSIAKKADADQYMHEALSKLKEKLPEL